MFSACICCYYFFYSICFTRHDPSSTLRYYTSPQDEEAEFQTGPLSVLTQSVKANTQASGNRNYIYFTCKRFVTATPRLHKYCLLSVDIFLYFLRMHRHVLAWSCTFIPKLRVCFWIVLSTCRTVFALPITRR